MAHLWPVLVKTTAKRQQYKGELAEPAQLDPCDRPDAEVIHAQKAAICAD